jgi:hypothetical protein
LLPLRKQVLLDLTAPLIIRVFIFRVELVVVAVAKMEVHDQVCHLFKQLPEEVHQELF